MVNNITLELRQLSISSHKIYLTTSIGLRDALMSDHVPLYNVNSQRPVLADTCLIHTKHDTRQDTTNHDSLPTDFQLTCYGGQKSATSRRAKKVKDKSQRALVTAKQHVWNAFSRDLTVLPAHPRVERLATGQLVGEMQIGPYDVASYGVLGRPDLCVMV